MLRALGVRKGHRSRWQIKAVRFRSLAEVVVRTDGRGEPSPSRGQNWRVAQSVERRPVKPVVVGSIPAAPAITKPLLSRFMRQFHCDQVMTQSRIPLKSGRVQIDYRCTFCGQHERDIRTSAGQLVRWINFTVKKRLAQSQSQGV